MTLLVFYAIIEISLTNSRRSKMSKYQARVYFLYPFLLAIFVYFYNIFFNAESNIDKTFLFFLVMFLSGVISLTLERKNILSEIVAIGGSIIILDLILIMSNSMVADFRSVVAAMFVSIICHVALFIVISVIYKFFEWIFDVKKPETSLNN